VGLKQYTITQQV